MKPTELSESEWALLLRWVSLGVWTCASEVDADVDALANALAWEIRHDLASLPDGADVAARLGIEV